MNTNEIRVTFKYHDCTQIGALSAFDSLVAVSKINDVGDAQLVAHWGVSDEDDAILDELDVADIIMEVWIRPFGHDTFLSDPAWSGFLRDAKIEQDGPAQRGTFLFKDFNHLLARRVVKPPDGGSHDEEYSDTANIMRNLVRRHCAELAEPDRQMPGLSVEANDGELGLYDDTSEMVFGSNLPEWVRANCLYEWNGYLYVGLEESTTTGQGASIYRTANGIVWERVYDAYPGIYSGIYTDEVHGIYCFKEFDGWLYAGAGSSNGIYGDGVLLRSFDGENWQVAHTFTDGRGVWSLEEYDGYLYAGLTAAVISMGEITKPWLARSADGFTWANIQTVTGICDVLGRMINGYVAVGTALKSWNNKLYVGMKWQRQGPGLFLANSPISWYGRIYESDDGTTFSLRLSTAYTEAFLSFQEFGDYLYTGCGRSRFTPFGCQLADVCFDKQAGRVYRTEDGASWVQVFGSNMGGDSQAAVAITSFLTTTNDDDGEPEIWAGGGSPAEANAKIWRSKDGETWNLCYHLSAPPYHFVLALSDFSVTAYHYASTGSYNRTKACMGSLAFAADYGDVWRIVPLASDVEQSGMAGRWTSLLAKLQEIAEQSGRHDFRVVRQDSFLYCANDYQEFVFQVRSPQWGTDNRWDGTRGVTFSLARGNMAQPVYSTIRGTRPTHMYLLGPSAEDDRIIEEYPNAEAQAESPWNRIEGAMDAQGVDSSQARASMGWAELEVQGPYRDLEFEAVETE